MAQLFEAVLQVLKIGESCNIFECPQRFQRPVKVGIQDSKRGVLILKMVRHNEGTIKSGRGNECSAVKRYIIAKNPKLALATSPIRAPEKADTESCQKEKVGIQRYQEPPPRFV